MEMHKPERRQAFLDPVREIIESDDFLKRGQKELAGISDKKDTLRHSQRIANCGYMLFEQFAGADNPLRKEMGLAVETCLLHDIGKTEVPSKYLTRPYGKFGPKDLRVVSEHAYRGYVYLKHKNRSPRVYYPVLLHHEFQKHDYPALGKELQEMKEVDIDNGRFLAILDVFDVYAFGRPHAKIAPLPPEQAKERLLEQFDLLEDEEIIIFLQSKIEEIKKLGI